MDAPDESHEIEDDRASSSQSGSGTTCVDAGDTDLKLYSLYSPPEHPDGTVHATKFDADAAEHHA